MKIKILVVIGVAICVAIGLLVKYWRQDNVIDSRTMGVNDIEISNVYFYSQLDQRWINEVISKDGDKYGSYGCTLCCLSMLLSSKNVMVDPLELKNKLHGVNGITDSGLVIWDQVIKVTGINIGPINNSHDSILKQLSRHIPVIAKIKLGDSVVHWVLITGVKDGRYSISDPLDRSRSVKYLDELSRKIYSIRSVKLD